MNGPIKRFQSPLCNYHQTVNSSRNRHQTGPSAKKCPVGILSDGANLGSSGKVGEKQVKYLLCSMNEIKLIELILPEGLLEYFEIKKVEKEKDFYKIYLEENNIPPLQYKEEKILSKGFYEPITIQDFPLRGKACFLCVKRRRWERESTGETISRDWDLVAKGTRMTSEFASFLKAINRYHTR